MRNPMTAAVTLTFIIAFPVVGLAEEAPASQKSLPEQLVDAFNAVFGVHPSVKSSEIFCSRLPQADPRLLNQRHLTTS